MDDTTELTFGFDVPYADPKGVEFFLNDFDKVEPENVETGLIFESDDPPGLKTRVCSAWLERRKFQTRIIISEATRERLTGRYHMRSLGSEIVKGKSKPVSIYEVLGRGESGTLPDPTVEPLPAKEAHP